MTQSWSRAITAAAVTLLVAIAAFGFIRDLSSGPHLDEIEHLHASLLRTRGERIFVDFHEHHSRCSTRR